jgi:hypothetical protein
MKITPVTSPLAIAPTGTPEADRTAKAVAAFNAGKSSYDKAPNANSLDLPVQNANKISPEELFAIKPAQSPEVIVKNAEEEALEASEPQSEEVKEQKVEEKPKEDPALSRQFAQLARQERALRQKAQQQQAEFQKQQDAFKAQQAAFEAKMKDYETGYISKSQFKADPLSVLANEGVSYDELTQQILNQQPTDPRIKATIDRLESKIKQLEEGAENAQKSYTEQQQQAYQSAVKQIEIDAKNLVRHDPNFETIKATGSVKDVVELITETYNKDGILLSVEEAAQEVENYLVDEAMKVTRIGKIKKRLEESNASANKAPQKSQAKQQQPQTMKTLTNAASSTRQLSAKERAILAFKGELKS